MVILDGRSDGSDQIARCNFQSAAQDDKLDNVDPSLTALDPGDHRLMAAQPFRQCLLAQTAVPSCSCKRFDERDLSCASDCAWQGPSLSLTGHA